MLQANLAGRVRLKLIVRIGDFCDLIWKITFGLVAKNLETTLNLTPKHVVHPEYVIYWKIPQVILRSKFLYLTVCDL